MPERVAVPPARAELLRQLRGRIGERWPGLRLVAERLLGAERRIDFVAVEADGGALLVLVGGEGEDLELIAGALAQRAWVQSRLPDWLQLAPDLGLRPEAGTRVLLLCPHYRPEALEAARALGPEALRLGQYRCLRNGSGLELLLEDLARDGGARAPDAPPEPPGPPTVPAPAFRTGLSDLDLDLSGEERVEFE